MRCRATPASRATSRGRVRRSPATRSSSATSRLRTCSGSTRRPGTSAGSRRCTPTRRDHDRVAGPRRRHDLHRRVRLRCGGAAGHLPRRDRRPRRADRVQGQDPWVRACGRSPDGGRTGFTSLVGVWDLAPVSVANGVVYVASMAKTGNEVYALDAATGAILWAYSVGSVYWGTGYSRSGIEGSGNNKLYAFSLDGQ